MAIRNGFINKHFAPRSKFDFHKYIKRSMEDDFKSILGISIPLWMFSIIFLLLNVHGWHALTYLSFVPLVILLLVGTKLELVIMEMGQQIQDKETIVRGAPVVVPSNKFFWFNSPHLVLFLIHFTLFQNAFQMAFFLWTVYEFGIHSCYHESIMQIGIRVGLGVIAHIMCSYITFPLYALVTQVDHGRPDLIDFISKMPDDVLVMILSRLPLKAAAATSSLSTRWRFVWRGVIRLNFDGTESLDQIAQYEKLSELDIQKYIHQVYSVINGYNQPSVSDFSIRFDLDNSYSAVIDDWIQFALGKKVEYLELNIMDHHHDPDENYNLRLPSSKAISVNMTSLKYLFLKGVNLNESTLNELLKNSPCLARLHMYSAGFFPHVHIGGHSTNLKQFKLVDCFGFETITLSGFGI